MGSCMYVGSCMFHTNVAASGGPLVLRLIITVRPTIAQREKEHRLQDEEQDHVVRRSSIFAYIGMRHLEHGHQDRPD